MGQVMLLVSRRPQEGVWLFCGREHRSRQNVQRGKKKKRNLSLPFSASRKYVSFPPEIIDFFWDLVPSSTKVVVLCLRSNGQLQQCVQNVFSGYTYVVG